MLSIARLDALRTLLDPEVVAAWLDEVDSQRQRRGSRSQAPAAIQTSAQRTESLLTVKELAGRLSIAESAVYEMARTKTLPHIRLGKRIRFSWTQVEDWLQEQSTIG